MAPWIEKHHGTDGELSMAMQMDRLPDDPDGMEMWRQVPHRYRLLDETSSETVP